MLRHLPLVFLLSGCGMGIAPPMELAESCSQGDLTVEVERGFPASCSDLLSVSQTYRAEYQARFGKVVLEGIPVRYRAGDHVFDGSATAHTYDDAIDLAAFHWADLPHELNHVRTGAGHSGWCFDFNPWSIAVLGIDQSSYLGCR